MNDAVINRISPDQRKEFQYLIDLADYRQLALVYAELDGKPVTVVSFVQEDNGEMSLKPLAIMVDEDLSNRLSAPGTFPVSVLNPEANEEKPFLPSDNDLGIRSVL